MILRSKLARVASAGLLALIGGTVMGCSASIGTKPPREQEQGWEETKLAGPTRVEAQRNVSSRPPTATFPGFHVVGEERKQSVVMVEVSRDVAVSEQQVEGRLVYVLAGTMVPEKVNRLPLVADQFGTSVSRVYLVQAGSDAHLVVELRAKVQHTHRVVQTDNGINLEISIEGPAYQRPGILGAERR